MEYSWLTKLFVTGSCPPRKSKPSCRMTLPVFSTHLSFYVYDVDAWVEVEKEMPPARLIDSLSRNRKQFRQRLQPVQRPSIASLQKLRKYTPCGTFWREVILGNLTLPFMVLLLILLTWFDLSLGQIERTHSFVARQ